MEMNLFGKIVEYAVGKQTVNGFSQTLGHFLVDPLLRFKNFQQTLVLKRLGQHGISYMVPTIHIVWKQDRDLIEEQEQ